LRRAVALRAGTRWGTATEAEWRADADRATDSELAAGGLSNKREIARELFVTVHTVEVHLSRACAKLAISSRGQLASRLSARAVVKD
jgi:DNA-binding CsgD family transcriptional regulator